MAAAAPLKPLRAGALALAFLALTWVGYETVHAGSNIPPPSDQRLTKLSGGKADGKRLDGRSWSLDYDTAVIAPDGSSAEINHVHDGLLYRNGKPFMRMRAQHVDANVAFNDFRVVGPVSFTEIGGQHKRLETVGAHYIGNQQTLKLDHPTTIREGPMTVRVERATVNFRTGQTTLGRIVGTM